jgi:hypothetical protein
MKSAANGTRSGVHPKEDEMKTTIKVSVRLEKTEDPRVEEGTIDVRGEDGRWACTGGWHRPLLRVAGRVYLHGRVHEALFGARGYRVGLEDGALRWGAGRRSATYVPVTEEEITRLASFEGGRSDRERERNEAIAAFGYALIDLLPRAA